VTAQRLGQDDREQNQDFLSRTMPLPAIDIAGFEPAPEPSRAAPRPPAESTAPAGRTAPAATSRTVGPGTGPGAGLAGVARGGLVNLAGAVISAASSVALAVIVTRNFSRSVVGTFFVAMSLFLIVEAVTNLGAYNGTIYFIARLRALQAERRIPAILRATVIPVVISSVIGAAALIAFVHPVSRLLLAGQASAPVRQSDLVTALRILAVALPFAALADTMLGATRGFHEMEPTVVVDRIGRSTLQLVGVISAAIAGSSALLAPLWALPYAPAAIIASLWLRRIMREQRHALPARRPATGTAPARSGDRGPDAVRPAADGFQPDNRHGKPNARGFWRFTAPRSIASVAQIIIQRLDIVLVGVMKGPVDAAIYTAATRFLVAGQLGNAAISMAAQPQLTRLFAIHDRAGANTVYQVTTAWLVLLTWPIYLLAAVFGPSVLAIFGRSYHAGSTVMLILALTMLFATACGQVDVVLITTGRSTWSLVNGLLAMCVNICVDVILIPRMGITGAAVGWAAAIVVSNLVPLVQVATAAKVHPFGRGLAAACGLTVLSFAVVPIGLRMLAGPRPGISIAATGLGAAVMVVGLWWLHGTLHLSAMPGLGRVARGTRPSQVRSLALGEDFGLPSSARYRPQGRKGSKVE
jgi:O-antigen/teichoic acid export membrane protein